MVQLGNDSTHNLTSTWVEVSWPNSTLVATLHFRRVSFADECVKHVAWQHLPSRRLLSLISVTLPKQPSVATFKRGDEEIIELRNLVDDFIKRLAEGMLPAPPIDT